MSHLAKSFCSSLPALPTGDAERDKEIETIRVLVQQEKSHGQWKKQMLNTFCLLLLVVMQLFRGGKSSVSFEECGLGDWSMTAVFIASMILVVYFSCHMIEKEQSLKQKFGNVNLAASDLIFRGTVLRNVLILGFVGGWVAGALGLGGGVIFNPLLLHMGVPPKVSSATGMYLITFSKVATTLFYILFGQLKMDYALWIAGWSSIGAVIGLYGANWYMKKFNRQSIIVFFLTVILALSTVGVPFFGALDLSKKLDLGEDIMKFKTICGTGAALHRGGAFGLGCLPDEECDV
jgi:uncharacterized membrane protein YfcA